jgi:hypothetical protein
MEVMERRQNPQPFLTFEGQIGLLVLIHGLYGNLFDEHFA